MSQVIPYVLLNTNKKSYGESIYAIGFDLVTLKGQSPGDLDFELSLLYMYCHAGEEVGGNFC